MCKGAMSDDVSSGGQAQRDSVKDFERDIPGGKAGQLVTPVDTAGCYAPGGRCLPPSPCVFSPPLLLPLSQLLHVDMRCVHPDNQCRLLLENRSSTPRRESNHLLRRYDTRNAY